LGAFRFAVLGQLGSLGVGNLGFDLGEVFEDLLERCSPPTPSPAVGVHVHPPPPIPATQPSVHAAGSGGDAFVVSSVLGNAGNAMGPDDVVPTDLVLFEERIKSDREELEKREEELAKRRKRE